MSHTSSLWLWAVSILVPIPGTASIISGNFGTSPPFYQSDSASPLGDVLGVSAIANGFVPSTDSQLATIQVAVSMLDLSGSNELHLSVTDDAGFTPGSVLETFDIIGQM